jgi:hypothetical protein
MITPAMEHIVMQEYDANGALATLLTCCARWCTLHAVCCACVVQSALTVSNSPAHWPICSVFVAACILHLGMDSVTSVLQGSQSPWSSTSSYRAARSVTPYTCAFEAVSCGFKFGLLPHVPSLYAEPADMSAAAQA